MAFKMDHMLGFPSHNSMIRSYVHSIRFFFIVKDKSRPCTNEVFNSLLFDKKKINKKTCCACVCVSVYICVLVCVHVYVLVDMSVVCVPVCI